SLFSQGRRGIDSFRGRTRVAAAFHGLLSYLLRQSLARDPINWRFAGSIDVEHEQRVRVVESAGELFHQIARPRVPVRLKDDVNLAEPTLPRRRQSSLNLGGMMPVVVNHADSGD